ncbi:Uncharacterized protein TCM_014053 [Theobroma cacao]|uniref:Uncharacterized protein n=1 Tax=Theobroma cacao TaxID=3641 RepID=A0A061G4C8_THECC|nr:Uncharacterized protein TCM_014053 [Theobroma cacao]
MAIPLSSGWIVGTWDIDFLLQSLPYQVLLRVVAMQIDTLSKDDDVAYWRLTSNGLFLVRATYESSIYGIGEINNFLMQLSLGLLMVGTGYGPKPSMLGIILAERLD